MAHKSNRVYAVGSRQSPPVPRTPTHDGEKANIGNIIVRQTGSSVVAGTGVRTGSDYTLYAVTSGLVKYTTRKKVSFNGARRAVKIVSIVAK